MRPQPWRRPRPIQAAALPYLLMPTSDAVPMQPNVLVQAENAAGKTGVFAVAALSCVNPAEATLQVVVVTPGREVAVQGAKAIAWLGDGIPGLGAGSILSLTTDKRLTEKELLEKLTATRILVCTIGKLRAILRFIRPMMSHVRLFVMDEADQMVADSRADLQEAYMAMRPEGSIGPRVLMCSATFDALTASTDDDARVFMESLASIKPAIDMAQRELADTWAAGGAAGATVAPAGRGGGRGRGAATGAAAPGGGAAGTVAGRGAAMKPNPRPGVVIAVEDITMKSLTHVMWDVRSAMTAGLDSAGVQARKRQLLASVAKALVHEGKGFVFEENTRGCTEAADLLTKAMGVRVQGVFGRLSAEERSRYVHEFSTGTTTRIVVATSALAKGVDIEGLRSVVHLDIPVMREVRPPVPNQPLFVHRSGRAGRAEGENGVIISMIGSDADLELYRRLLGSRQYRYMPYEFRPPLSAGAVTPDTYVTRFIQFFSMQARGAMTGDHVQPGDEPGTVYEQLRAFIALPDERVAEVRAAVGAVSDGRAELASRLGSGAAASSSSSSR